MRRVLGLGLLIIAAGVFGQTTFHGNVARTGVYESAGPTQLKGVKWTFKTGGAIVASPAIADGVVYITSLDGHLFAIDEETGKEKWNFKSRMPIASSPAVANGKVYFGSGDGNVYAVTADTGLELWKVQTKDVVHASPAVFNHTVYIGSWDSYLYALNGETGEEKWTFKAGEDNTIHNQVGFQSSPAVVDGVVYVG